jgi:predicted dienelactone hydrolase
MNAHALAAVLTAGFILLTSQAAGAVGFRWVAVPNGDGKPIELAIWYPSDAPTAPQPFELFRQDVAADAAVAGSGLPLIIISHGTGGSAAGHYDTALALAKAGFVVTALVHPGDNWRDRSNSFTLRNLTERPRQLHTAIDYMLSAWPGRDHLDPARVGVFGHSAGGFTALVAIGGDPDMGRAIAFCREHIVDWGCRRARERTQVSADSTAGAPEWRHDGRIKAAVIAAPALGNTFAGGSLASAAALVQLWQAEDDRITPRQWNGDIVKAALPTAPNDHLVAGAGHFAFLAPCSASLSERVPEICRDNPGFDRVAFHETFNVAIATFFARTLATH